MNYKIKDESGDKKYFTIIPNYVLNHSTLWDREVYIQMKRITGEDGTCWTSQKTLSKQCGISINRLKKSLDYLIKHKWIKFIGKKQIKTTGGYQSVNEYRIIDLWNKNNEFYNNKGVSPDDTPTTKGVSPDDAKGCHENAKGVSPGDDKEEPLNNIPLNNIISEQGSQTNKIIKLFEVVNPSYEKLFKNKTQRSALERLLKKYGEEKVAGLISYLPILNSDKYAKGKSITPLQLEDNLAHIVNHYKSNQLDRPAVINFDKKNEK